MSKSSLLNRTSLARMWATRPRNVALFLATLACNFCCQAYGYQKAETKEPSAPSVDLQAVVERDSVKRGESVAVFFLVTNKSGVELKNPQVTLLNPGALIAPNTTDANHPLPTSPSLTKITAF